MDKQQRIAWVMSNAIAAQIEAMGMAAGNAQHPENPPFRTMDFENLLVKYELQPHIVNHFLVHD